MHAPRTSARQHQTCFTEKITMFFTTTTRRITRAFVLATCLGATLAMAQAEPSLNDVYAAARAGRLEQAQTMVQQVLVAHPSSAKAFYVRSELFARHGDLRHGRESFATAQKLAPGLPFAKPEAVQALRAQLAGAGTPFAPANASQPVARYPNTPSPASWGLPLLLAAGVLAGGYMLFRRRPPQPLAMQSTYATGNGSGATDGSGIGGGVGVMQPSYGQPAYAQPGYGQQAGYAPPASSGLGGRIMGGVATGLAVGAGVMAAEAIGRNLMGRQASGGASDNNFSDPVEPTLNRNVDMGGQDFGVTDAGGWDSSSSPDMGSGDWDS
jgi:hypothetical protein